MTEQERVAASAENYRRMRAELDRRLSLDPELRKLSKKIRNGKADFNDTFRYSEIVSKYLGEIMQENIGTITNPLGKEYVCKELLRDHYEAINDVLGEVQVALDEELGIHLNPVKAPRNDERIAQVAHALEDPTVNPETIRRRAKAPVVNTAMSMHDDYIRVNAKLRNDLGLKPIIQRFGTGCCSWCSAVAGKWRFGEQPDDVFRRHDNCNCTIIYDTQVLRGHQNEDGSRTKKWEEVDPKDVEANGFVPTVNTPEQAEKLQAKLSEGLTIPGQGSIMNTGRVEPANSQDILEFTNLLHELGFQKVEGFEHYSESKEHLLEIATSFTKLHSDFPQCFKGLNISLGIVKGMNDETYAGYLHENETLYLNPLYYNNIEMYSKQYENDVKSKYHPEGTSYKATVYHEFGHRVEAVSGEVGKKLAKQIFEKQNGRYFTRKLGDEWIGKNLSKYAFQFNYDEFIPESFAEFYDSDSPRIVCQQVIEIMKNRGA